MRIDIGNKFWNSNVIYVNYRRIRFFIFIQGLNSRNWMCTCDFLNHRFRPRKETREMWSKHSVTVCLRRTFSTILTYSVAYCKIKLNLEFVYFCFHFLPKQNNKLTIFTYFTSHIVLLIYKMSNTV